MLDLSGVNSAIRYAPVNKSARAISDEWPLDCAAHSGDCEETTRLFMNDDVTKLAERLLARIRTELLETGAGFGIDSDLFEAGLDSMSLMQLTLMIEEEFATTLPDRLITRDTFSTARQIAEVILSEKSSHQT